MKKQRIPRKDKKRKLRERKRWMNKMLDCAVEIAFKPSVNSNTRLSNLYVGGIDAYDVNSISKSYGGCNKQKYSEHKLPESKKAIELLQNEFLKKVEK